jgi:hypothetical protein
LYRIMVQSAPSSEPGSCPWRDTTHDREEGKTILSQLPGGSRQRNGSCSEGGIPQRFDIHPSSRREGSAPAWPAHRRERGGAIMSNALMAILILALFVLGYWL